MYRIPSAERQSEIRGPFSKRYIWHRRLVVSWNDRSALTPPLPRKRSAEDALETMDAWAASIAPLNAAKHSPRHQAVVALPLLGERAGAKASPLAHGGERHALSKPGHRLLHCTCRQVFNPLGRGVQCAIHLESRRDRMTSASDFGRHQFRQGVSDLFGVAA